MFRKVFKIVVNCILLTTIFCLLTFFDYANLSTLARVILLVVGNLLFVFSIVFGLFRLVRLSRFFYAIFVTFCIVMGIYTLLCKLEILSMFTSVTALKEYILSTKELGVFVYILIQIFQVVVIPVPAAIVCIVGSVVYGPLLGGIYCSIGVLIGSYISFWLGKTFGYRLVSWIVGKQSCEKYSKIIRKRGIFFLALSFLLPLFPDDVLCLIAGITNMTFRSFFLVTLITRPIGVICMSYFGSGYLIPFSGWGLYIWPIILVLAISMVVISFKFQENIENFVLSKVFRNNKSKSVK